MAHHPAPEIPVLAAFAVSQPRIADYFTRVDGCIASQGSAPPYAIPSQPNRQGCWHRKGDLVVIIGRQGAVYIALATEEIVTALGESGLKENQKLRVPLAEDDEVLSESPRGEALAIRICAAETGSPLAAPLEGGIIGFASGAGKGIILSEPVDPYLDEVDESKRRWLKMLRDGCVAQMKRTTDRKEVDDEIFLKYRDALLKIDVPESAIEQELRVLAEMGAVRQR